MRAWPYVDDRSDAELGARVAAGLGRGEAAHAA
jgi:hypothetical protein